jgi:hypothetical protein
MDGMFPGWPEDDSQLLVALRWLSRVEEIEAIAYGRLEREIGLRIVDGQLDPVVVDAEKARAAGYGDLVDEQGAAAG